MGIQTTDCTEGPEQPATAAPLPFQRFTQSTLQPGIHAFYHEEHEEHEGIS